MLKKFPRLKKFFFFLTCLKTAQFVVSLIILGKWYDFAGIKIHPKTILTYTNKAHKAREKDAQGADVRRACKARE